jgi:hypothetical protein
MSKDKHQMFQNHPAADELTPRDLFACGAMIGMLSQRTSADGESDERTYGFIAHASYMQAAAMLAERDKLEAQSPVELLAQQSGERP